MKLNEKVIEQWNTLNEKKKKKYEDEHDRLLAEYAEDLKNQKRASKSALKVVHHDRILASSSQKKKKVDAMESEDKGEHANSTSKGIKKLKVSLQKESSPLKVSQKKNRVIKDTAVNSHNDLSSP